MIGSWELILIFLLALVLFGGKRLPEFARNLGKGIREFKDALNGTTPSQENIKIEDKPPQKDNEVK